MNLRINENVNSVMWYSHCESTHKKLFNYICIYLSIYYFLYNLQVKYKYNIILYINMQTRNATTAAIKQIFDSNYYLLHLITYIYSYNALMLYAL